MRVAIGISSVLLGLATAAPLVAQKPSGHLGMGIKAHEAMKPAEALQHYRAALAEDSLNFEANWRAAMAAIETAQLLPPPEAAAAPAEDDENAGAPDSLYTDAETYARRALAIDTKHAQGHFIVAYVLGSRSLISDPLTRLSMAKEIWQESSDAVLLDPKHDGAHHIVGQFTAEIMRLGSFERGYAEGELGDIVTNASWETAVEHLEKAVELAPTIVYHRLDLARAYLSMDRKTDAEAQVAKIESLPMTMANDSTYKARAKALLQETPAAEPAPAAEATPDSTDAEDTP